MPRNDFDDFDRHFAKTSRTVNRTFGFAAFFGIIWLLFLMGAIGTAIWLAGRWTGVW
ncbi:MAG: hypothetical protein ACOH2M_03310 [Cypionkella sp.]